MGHILDNDQGLEEDDHLSVNALELKRVFEKISSRHPFSLDIEQPNNNQRCNQESCPYGNKLTSIDNIRFLSLDKNLARQSFDLAEYGASNSVNLFCRKAFLFNIPVSLCSTEFFIEILQHHRRVRSTTTLGDFTVEYASTAGAGNVIISSSGQWIFGSVEKILKARALLKSSLFFQLATIDSTMARVIARNFNTRQTKFSANSPSRFCDTSLQDHKAKSVSPENQRSELKVSGKMVASCSSTNPCSYQSTSSEHSSVSKGLLHCIWNSGTPYFVFSMDVGGSEVYVANPCKIGSSVEKALDYIYLFHSRTGSKKESRNCSNNASDLVGKMKVSSSLILNSSRSNVMETEFVLFGADKDHSWEMQSPTSTLVKSRGLSKMTDIFRPSHPFKLKSNYFIGEPSTQIQDFLQGPCLSLSGFSDFDKSVLANLLENDFPPNLELAAITVKDNQHDNNVEAAISGWGLKFLEKITIDQFDTHIEPSFSSHRGENSQKGSKGASARSINVLLPAGFHGGPATGTGGPSSLTERWRSGGHCDCGGWDIGCPLTLLSNKSIVSEAFPHEESQEDFKSVNLFIEGTKHGEPSLKMVCTNEGVYSMYFQSTISALQSFSIGVAIIHSQTPTLCAKL